jgi:tryptophan-rich sensory protein
LAQYAAGCVFEGVGYAGLLLFVLRVPGDKTEPRWRPLERALPLVALVIALALIATYGSVFGYRTETGTRMVIMSGFVIDLCALVILMVRRRTQTPEDYQRVRWVIWGCLIGLPAFIIASLGQETTFFVTPWGDFTHTDDVLGLLYLVNGILCLFVFEAVRRERVVSVAIPLRRVTILGLTLSIPALLLHHEIDRIQGHLDLPSWAWLAIGTVILFLVSRLHDIGVDLADRYFNRALDRAALELGQAILKAENPAEIDRLLADEPFRVLKLTSAAAFRWKGSVFSRDGNGNGWGSTETSTLRADEPILAPLSKGAPFSLNDKGAGELRLPSGLKRPILAVPAANPIHCFAVALYGPHASGADLDTYERAMLTRIAEDAAAVYAELEINQLRSRIATFEQQVSTSGLRRKPA